MTDEERMHLADEAKALLKNKAFNAAVEALSRHYVAAWKAAKTTEAREDAHRYVMLADRFVADLNAILLDGELTAKRVKELQGRALW